MPKLYAFVREPKSAIYLLALLALAIRLYNLSFESLDMDEADGVAFASRPIAEALALLGNPGENGPLYYLALKLWMALGGRSEFAIRFLAVIPGVLAVPLIYTLALNTMGRTQALVSVVLVTFSSYLLYYSQMNKMYSLVLLTSLLSSYLLLKAMDSRKWAFWGIYAVSITLNMYLHIFSALLVPWHLAFFVTKVRSRSWSLAPGITAFSAVILPSLPLGLSRLNMLAHPESLERLYDGPHSALAMLDTLSREYGTRFDLPPPLPLSFLFMGLTGAGLLLTASDRRKETSWFLALGLFIPLLITYAMVALGAPLFSSRYLIISLPAFILLWAVAIGAATKPSPVLAYGLLAAVVSLNAARWYQTNVEGLHFREDWRGASRYLDERMQPRDLLLLPRSNVANAFRYYAGGHSAILGMEAAVDQRGEGLGPEFYKAIADREELWVMRAYFQEKELEPLSRWLVANAYVLDHVNFPGVFVTHYLMSPVLSPSASLRANSAEGAGAEALQPKNETNIVFGDKLLLLGYNPLEAPRLPGGPWALRLYWGALQPMDRDYSAAFTLRDGQGRAIARSKGAIAQNRYPTSKWEQGWTIPEEREFFLPYSDTDGPYTLLVEVYDADGGKLDVTLGDGNASQRAEIAPLILEKRRQGG